MTPAEATALIRPAVAGRIGDWADLGAGAGTFTAALAGLLGAPHSVTAVERDVAALAQLRQLATSLPRTAATIRVVATDLAGPTSLDAFADGSLSGVLFGNVLHYFADPLPLLRAAARKLRRDGVVTVLEYENARPNPWVPHPLSQARLGELAEAAGLATPDVVAERASRWQGKMYCAVMAPAHRDDR
jgi:SAM-dependent methyltransferase